MGLLSVYSESFKGLSKESWMLSVVMLINRAGSMVLPFLGVYMTDHLGFSIANAGIILGFYGVGSVLGSLVGGWLTDRFGEYRVQFLSLLLSVPLFLLIPIFSSIWGMAAIILLQSTVTECFRPANSVAITKYAKPENITRSFSLNRMAINLGFSVGPALGGILSAISYEFLFALNALAALVSAIVYFKFFSKRNKEFKSKLTQNQSQKEQTGRKGGSPYRDFPFLIYSFLCMIFAVCFFQFFNTIPIFYKEVVHLDQQTIGYVLGYSGFIIVIFEMLLVNLADKYLSLPSTLLVGSVLVGISFLLLAVDSHVATIFLSISVLSFGEILAFPFMSTITALRSGEENKGAYMGLNGMSFAASFVITPLLGTWIASEFGFNTLWVGTVVVMVLVGLGLYQVVKSMVKKRRTA